MTCTRFSGGIVCHQPNFKPGDPEPTGYLAWHEWAEVQHKAGLRQKQCCRCGKFKYPQELSDRVHRTMGRVKRGGSRYVSLESAICKGCEQKCGSAA